MSDQGPGTGKRSIAAALVRERAGDAMLELSGEIGYRAVTLDQLVDRGELSAAEFEREFGSLESCFAAAYAEEAEELLGLLLDAAVRAGEWRAGVRAAVVALLGFTAERPAVANALIREVHVVGGAALVKHEEVLERLSLAIAGGCELPPDARVATERAPSFVVGAIEGVLAGRLARGETDGLPELAPELMYLVVASFLGQEAAVAELERGDAS